VSDAAVRPLWRGRVLALVGILLVASNLRIAVASLSPIYADVTHSFALSSVALGVLGMLPPVCFALAAIFAPLLTRLASLEVVLIWALVAIVVGDAVRAASGSFAVLGIGSIVVFAGMGVGNVLLPPLVKRYFPDRIGLMTSLYAFVISIGTLVPPLVAVPVAAEVGWRFSAGMWLVLAVAAAVPWLAILAQRRVSSGEPEEVEEPKRGMMRLVWRSSVAWALAVCFAVSSLNAYALFAWLPQILHDTAGTSPLAAGDLLSLYSAMGIPAALLIPVLTSRMKNVAVLIYVSVVLFFVGYLGLIFLPHTAIWLWVACAGLGPLLFPLCLVLINLRTRTHEGAVALSSFTQGAGYVMGAFGPLIVGLLHQLTGEWTLALWALTATALAAAIAGAVVARPHMLEDSLRTRLAAPSA
jgi:CP family cyanate transporter-like MFS transporter